VAEQRPFQRWRRRNFDKEVNLANTKKMFFVVALITSLISVAAAQNSRLPEASLDREVNLQVPAEATVLGNPTHQTQTPPKYCRPCLFYAGDYDSNASDANGLANEFDIIISTGAAVYAPFIVPKGKIWTVTGLFTDDLLEVAALDPVTIPLKSARGFLGLAGMAAR